MTFLRRTLFVVTALSFLAVGFQASLARGGEDAIDFNRQIRPLLSDKCFACHGPDDNVREADLRLDLKEGLVGGESPVVVPGDPEESELHRRITSDDPDEIMPPPSSNKSLSKSERALLKQWIKEGAQWQVHWAYVDPVKNDPPKVAGLQSNNPIDHFIRHRLEERQLKPSEQADRITLIRRLYFDLLGLPPTPEQVERFQNDTSPDAYERVVEELLRSPHFGERLAVYWLDVVRFSDSNGYHSDEPRKIGPYRDYVIESFNKNLPYDQFVVEQLAGDLLPNAGMQQHVASGFNMLLQTTSEGGAQAKEYIAKYAADRVRNTSQIFLGSTMGCAECHNHKFDPFTQADFYNFAAFFADIQQPAVGNPATYPVVSPKDDQRLAEFDRQLADLRKALNASTPELEKAQAAWESEIASRVASSPEFSAWHQIGPFRGGSFDAVHAAMQVDPANVQLDAPVGKLKWAKAKGLVDGKVFNLPPHANAAHYFFRTVTVDSPSMLGLSLGSDDGIVVWLNGKKIHDNKVSRGVAPDQDKVTASLTSGENQLLIKVSNGGGGHGFYFRPTDAQLPANVAAIVKVEASKRSDAQQAELAKYYRSISPALQPVREKLAAVESQKKAFADSRPRTMMTKTGKPRVVRLLNRGNWMDESGPVMQPAVPSFLGKLEVEGRASRLDLARWIVDRDNPLTARTFVNRLWKLYFGRGLATPLDDLGRQGALPTHPELLDWLAVEFMDSGWDVKHMIRLMVNSETYRQSSQVSAKLKQVDPLNELYARQSRFRLDAETVRDNALAVSGLLVRDIGGPSVHPYQPAGYWRHMNFPARKWPTGKGNDLYRRGLYTWWQRMFLHPAMVAF